MTNKKPLSKDSLMQIWLNFSPKEGEEIRAYFWITERWYVKEIIKAIRNNDLSNNFVKNLEKLIKENGEIKKFSLLHGGKKAPTEKDIQLLKRHYV